MAARKKKPFPVWLTLAVIGCVFVYFNLNHFLHGDGKVDHGHVDHDCSECEHHGKMKNEGKENNQENPMGTVQSGNVTSEADTQEVPSLDDDGDDL